jgi:hypothetical protein
MSLTDQIEKIGRALTAEGLRALSCPGSHLQTAAAGRMFRVGTSLIRSASRSAMAQACEIKVITVPMQIGNRSA